ncbi:MAG: peptidylprolyl isomerase [Ruminococcus sp.]|nr:peptidylprolyl isomerase [Ruminococcus sp.]
MKRNLLKCLAFSVSAVMLAGVITGCGDESSEEIKANTSSSGESSDETEVTTSNDDNIIVITLYPDYAPITCENFENLVEEGFYDGLTFHRVVEDFMAQGGDPNGDGTGGSDETITGEFAENGIENDLSHTRGIVSMARSTDYNSASSQFFICYTDDCIFLDGSYAAFGEVTEGMDVVDSFLEVSRSLNSGGEVAVPDNDIIIESAVMIEDDEDGNPRVQLMMNDFLDED